MNDSPAEKALDWIQSDGPVGYAHIAGNFALLKLAAEWHAEHKTLEDALNHINTIDHVNPRDCYQQELINIASSQVADFIREELSADDYQPLAAEMISRLTKHFEREQ